MQNHSTTQLPFGRKYNFISLKIYIYIYKKIFFLNKKLYKKRYDQNLGEHNGE